MSDLQNVRIQLLDQTTGAVIKEVDVLTSANSVSFSDGTTFQDKLDAGTLKGATGSQGVKGTTGNTGAIGDTGVQGIQGFKGDLGNTGSQGAKGDLGDTGVQGIQGIQGIQGVTGDVVKMGTDYATGSNVKLFLKLI